MSRRLAVAVTAALLLTGGAAAADPASTTRDGRTLSVSKADGLRVEGEKVRVRGTGYDRNRGIYVAFCVDNGPGKVPTPCGGGADTEGSSGNSVWISDFPPAYGTGLAQPYGDGGSFDVEISVRALLRADDPETEQDETVDCRTTACAVVTRNDHTRSEDRGQDVAVPVSFASATTDAPAAAPAPADGSGRAVPAPATSSGTSGGTSGESEPVAAPGSAALDDDVAGGASPSGAASPGAAALTAPLVADDEDPVAAAGPVAVAASAGGDGSLLPLLLAGGLAAAGGASALLWRRRAGTPGHA